MQTWSKRITLLEIRSPDNHTPGFSVSKLHLSFGVIRMNELRTE
jgi:hypothetical protein